VRSGAARRPGAPFVAAHSSLPAAGGSARDLAVALTPPLRPLSGADPEHAERARAAVEAHPNLSEPGARRRASAGGRLLASWSLLIAAFTWRGWVAYGVIAVPVGALTLSICSAPAAPKRQRRPQPQGMVGRGCVTWSLACAVAGFHVVCTSHVCTQVCRANAVEGPSAAGPIGGSGPPVWFCFPRPGSTLAACNSLRAPSISGTGTARRFPRSKMRKCPRSSAGPSSTTSRKHEDPRR
jgi:hypothetical protein